MTAGTIPDAGSLWDGLVTAALLGTARRPVSVEALRRNASGAVQQAAAALDEQDPARLLLDVAALEVVRRRAGTRPVDATALRLPHVPPAAPERLPEVSPAAVLRLHGLLEGDTELLTEWLRVARDAGRRVPPSLLVRLLTATAASPELRDLVLAVGGARAGWLVAQWRAAGHPTAAQFPSAATGPDALPADGDLDAPWQTWTGPRREALLLAVRRSDPDRARDLLVSTWASEPPADRPRWLAALRTGLGPADEEFLEHALDDRRAETRAVAAALLAVLPGSALGHRMARRALASVRVERRLLTSRIAVGPLPERNAATTRDGVPPYRGQGGEGRWLLVHVVAATPLGAWVPALGGSPEDVLATPVEGDWAHVLHEGWARAAAAQRHGGWATALLRHDGLALPHGLLVPLVDAVPPAVRADVAARLLSAGVSARDGERWMLLDALLHRCPAPWPPALAEAVVGWLVRLAPNQAIHVSRGLVRLAGRRLSPDLAPVLADHVARRPPDLLTGMLAEAADLLTFRRDLHEELTS